VTAGSRWQPLEDGHPSPDSSPSKFKRRSLGLANKTAVLYQHIKIGGKWTYQKAPTKRLRHLSEGAYYLSWYEGTRKQLESVGPDPDVAKVALDKKSAELAFIATGGEVKEAEVKPAEEERGNRKSVADAINEYLDDCRDRQGKSGYGLAKTTVDAYRNRLGYLTEFKPEAFLDEVDLDFIKRFRRFLLNHPDDLGDRSCYNAMQAVSTFLIKYDINVAKKILKEMSFPPKPLIPYTNDELAIFFGASTEEEARIFKFFLHSMGREREVAFCETRDLLFDKNVLHISPKPDKGFRLKGKRSGQATKGSKVPMPTAFMGSMKKQCEGKGPRGLVFPNGQGGIQNHFLRLCKKIAKRAGLANWQEWDLHRWRKTGATRHHESGVSVRKIQSWLGHESLAALLNARPMHAWLCRLMLLISVCCHRLPCWTISGCVFSSPR
jgi:integrase